MLVPTIKPKVRKYTGAMTPKRGISKKPPVETTARKTILVHKI